MRSSQVLARWGGAVCAVEDEAAVLHRGDEAGEAAPEVPVEAEDGKDDEQGL